MNKIKIYHPYAQGVTIVSNEFIDHYMPIANGEFVKIFLYLLRTISDITQNFILPTAADALNCTEADILRALRYWEKSGLLQLNFLSDHTLDAITFCFDASSNNTNISFSSPGTDEIAISRPKEDNHPTDTSHVTLNTEPKKITLTPDKIKSLKENQEISQLLFIAQQYLGKTLTPSDTNSLLYYFDELHFSADLIEYLIEYCVLKGHNSMRYIDKVAFAWAKEGISTVQMAKESTSPMRKEYFTVLKAFGITNRSPIPTETKIIDTWLNEYAFTIDVIVEACTRTVKQTNQPSFQYADGILNRWKKHGVKHLTDIDGLDIEHRKAAKASAERKQEQNNNSSNNTFNNFNQRTYDYNELEKQLLNQ